jgi:hypothetical protein
MGKGSRKFTNPEAEEHMEDEARTEVVEEPRSDEAVAIVPEAPKAPAAAPPKKLDPAAQYAAGQWFVLDGHLVQEHTGAAATLRASKHLMEKGVGTVLIVSGAVSAAHRDGLNAALAEVRGK